MAEKYTDAKNNTYNIIHKTRTNSEKQESMAEREQKIVEELYRILIHK